MPSRSGPSGAAQLRVAGEQWGVGVEAVVSELDAAIGKQQASQRVRDAVLLDALEALGAARSATEAAVKRAVVEAVASKAAPQREIASLAGVAFSTVQKWTQNGIDDRRRA